MYQLVKNLCSAENIAEVFSTNAVRVF